MEVILLLERSSVRREKYCLIFSFVTIKGEYYGGELASPCNESLKTTAMYKTNVILFLVVLGGMTTAHAQLVTGLNKDSLKNLLARMPYDTNRVLATITLGQQYESTDPDSALYFYFAAGELSKKLNYPVGIIKYISNYTAVLNVQGKMDESIRLNEEAAAISEDHGLKLYAGKSYTNLGAAYQYEENYLKAVEYYLKALPLIERHGDLQSQAVLLANLCGLYRNMNQSDKAIDYARRALKISIKLGDAFVEGLSSINLGNCYKDIKNYQKATLYYKKGLQLATQIGDVNLLETALINLGNLYLDLDEPEKYIPIFYQALPLTDSIGDVSGKAFVLLGIGEGLFRDQRWREAESHLYKAIAFSKANNQKEVLQKLYQTLSDVYIATHRFKEGRSFRARHDSLEVLLVNADMLESVQSLEAKYTLEQQQNALLSKDLQLQQSQAESTRQRYWLIISLVSVVLLLLLLVLWYLYYRQRQLIHKQTINVLEADKKTVQLQSLLEGQQQERIRISQEIHDDMGSGLTSILFLSRSLLIADEPERQTIHKLSSLATALIEKMNEIVWAMRSAPEPLADFISHLRSQAGELLSNAGIDLQFDVEGSIPSVLLPTEYRHHLYLIIKEAIHNIIKHSKASEAYIHLTFHSHWEIEIRDNGIGIADANKPNGNGLLNMRKRATLIKGELSVTSGDGTRLHLTLPRVI